MSELLTEWNRASIPDRALEPLFEINQTLLSLLTAQSDETICTQPIELVAQLRGLWRRLDADALKQAARCPILLVEFDVWTPNIPRNPPRPEWCPRASATSLMHSVLTLAWHLCRTDPQIASVRLGIPHSSVHFLQDLRLQDINTLVDTQFAALCPRWEQRLDFWKHLLMAAINGEPEAISETYIEALDLLVSELSLPLPPHRHFASPRAYGAQNLTSGSS